MTEWNVGDLVRPERTPHASPRLVIDLEQVTLWEGLSSEVTLQLVTLLGDCTDLVLELKHTEDMGLRGYPLRDDRVRVFAGHLARCS